MNDGCIRTVALFDTNVAWRQLLLSRYLNND